MTSYGITRDWDSNDPGVPSAYARALREQMRLPIEAHELWCRELDEALDIFDDRERLIDPRTANE